MQTSSERKLWAKLKWNTQRGRENGDEWVSECEKRATKDTQAYVYMTIWWRWKWMDRRMNGLNYMKNMFAVSNKISLMKIPVAGQSDSIYKMFPHRFAVTSCQILELNRFSLHGTWLWWWFKWFEASISILIVHENCHTGSVSRW